MTPQRLDEIHTIVVHCSATRCDQDVSAADIDTMHKARGWSMIGYHRVIRLDGSIEKGRDLERRGAHVAGNNKNTVGICMIGGLNIDGRPADTFNGSQYHALFAEISYLSSVLPALNKVCGHRDFSPDINGDGLITPEEWIKDCPCFDVVEWMEIEGISWINTI